MVDALRECWRVLTPDGLLIDLRPIATTAPIEVVTPEHVVRAGSIDGSPGIIDDIASEHAMNVAVSEGWLERTDTLHFDFNFYWDGVDEMAVYLVDHWQRRRIDPSPADLYAVREAVAMHASDSPRLRSKERMLLAVYRRR